MDISSAISAVKVSGGSVQRFFNRDGGADKNLDYHRL